MNIMKEHEEQKTIETYIGTVVITYNHAIECVYMGKIESNYTAALMVDGDIRCVGTGLIRESALLNLFREYAKFQVPEMI